MKFNKIHFMSFLIEAFVASKTFAKTQYRPVVIWHGMGDTCCNEQSIGGFMEILKELLPDTFVHSVMVSDSDSELIERKNSYFGNVNNHVDYVCNRLREDDIYPYLKDGFNAIGFSQGGQFLRAYVERCNDPPVYNLITYGGQHNGVSAVPGCINDDSDFCARMRVLLSSNVYSSFIQKNVVQAQYFKSIDNYDEYLEKSLFLADINNEREEKNAQYKENMLKLNKFVMIRFEEDQTVVPASTTWFGWVNDLEEPIPMNETLSYKEDWIGLKTLEKDNKLDFLTTPGEHMQVDIEYFLENVFHPYLDEPVTDDNNDGDDDDDDSDDDSDDDDDNDDDSDDDDDNDDDNDQNPDDEDLDSFNLKNKKANDYFDSFIMRIQN